ncbi:hypothetical protein OG21DRAFT_1491947 [Imleria badia]|nr:hypothetical protein OG21DRAFT_1491947 [Imleria badia]
MAKHKIIYESEDDVEDRAKRSRANPDDAPPKLARDTLNALGKTEWSKRPLRIDIVTQDEDINPMAPSSQDAGERGPRRGRLLANNLALEYQMLRLNRRATRSAPPLSGSPSLFSNGGRSSTVATSHAPPVCYPQPKDFEPDSAPSHPPPARLQWTASFYDQPLCMNRSGHSLSAAPDLDDGAGPLIDKVSPSEDDRITEANLHQAEYSRGSPPPIDEHFFSRLSPSPEKFDISWYIEKTNIAV